MCGKDSDKFGDHDISACAHYGNRSSRHDDLQDAIFATAQAASLAPTKEEHLHIYHLHIYHLHIAVSVKSAFFLDFFQPGVIWLLQIRKIKQFATEIGK
jgi:hypothetical protein